MDDIKRRFQYHPPQTAEDRMSHQTVNDIVEAAARDLVVIVPEGRERALVLTKLEEARMWANAGLAHARAGREG